MCIFFINLVEMYEWMESEPTLNSACCTGPGPYSPIGQFWLLGQFRIKSLKCPSKLDTARPTQLTSTGRGCSHQPGHPSQEFHNIQGVLKLMSSPVRYVSPEHYRYTNGALPGPDPGARSRVCWSRDLARRADPGPGGEAEVIYREGREARGLHISHLPWRRSTLCRLAIALSAWSTAARPRYR